jgi:quinol monooxygenase YgiN
MKKTTLDFIFTFTVKKGAEAEFDALTTELLAVTKENDPGVMIYNIFKNADGGYCQLERFRDSAAWADHMQNTAGVLAKWTEITQISQMIVLGDIDRSIREALDGIDYHHYEAHKFLDR